MYHDVSELRDFYYRSALGRSVRSRLCQSVDALWGDAKGDALAGFGFASPLLRPFFDRFTHIVNLMPEGQGVMAWPNEADNVSVLCAEEAWPLIDASIDRMIILHAIENSESAALLLGELMRVLAPFGRALVIIPNRSGIWARREHTPFGFGRPFSMSQAEALFSRHGFEILRRFGALYAPPMRSRIGLRTQNLWEWGLGRKHKPLFAGALILEIAKRRGGEPITARRRKPVLAQPDLVPLSRGMERAAMMGGEDEEVLKAQGSDPVNIGALTRLAKPNMLC